MKVVYLLRKPLSEGTITANVLKHGTGAINIDACRVGTGGDKTGGGCSGNSALHEGGIKARSPVDRSKGRWPSNVVIKHLDGCKDSSCDTGCPVKAMGDNSRFYRKIGGFP